MRMGQMEVKYGQGFDFNFSLLFSFFIFFGFFNSHEKLILEVKKKNHQVNILDNEEKYWGQLHNLSNMGAKTVKHKFHSPDLSPNPLSIGEEKPT